MSDNLWDDLRVYPLAMPGCQAKHDCFGHAGCRILAKVSLLVEQNDSCFNNLGLNITII